MIELAMIHDTVVAASGGIGGEIAAAAPQGVVSAGLVGTAESFVADVTNLIKALFSLVVLWTMLKIFISAKGAAAPIIITAAIGAFVLFWVWGGVEWLQTLMQDEAASRS